MVYLVTVISMMNSSTLNYCMSVGVLFQAFVRSLWPLYTLLQTLVRESSIT